MFSFQSIPARISSVLISCLLLAVFWSTFSPIQFLASSFNQKYYNQMVQEIQNPAESEILDALTIRYQSLQSAKAEPHIWVREIQDPTPFSTLSIPYEDNLDPFRDKRGGCPPFPECTPIPENCFYDMIIDPQGCVVGCGDIVCEESDIREDKETECEGSLKPNCTWDQQCQQVCQEEKDNDCPRTSPCPAPPEGCVYEKELDENGCPVGCGTIVCNATPNIEVSRTDDFENRSFIAGQDDIPVLKLEFQPQNKAYTVKNITFEIASTAISPENIVFSLQNKQQQIGRSQTGNAKISFDDIALLVEDSPLEITVFLDTIENSLSGEIQITLVSGNAVFQKENSSFSFQKNIESLPLNIISQKDQTPVLTHLSNRIYFEESEENKTLSSFLLKTPFETQLEKFRFFVDSNKFESLRNKFSNWKIQGKTGSYTFESKVFSVFDDYIEITFPTKEKLDPNKTFTFSITADTQESGDVFLIPNTETSFGLLRATGAPVSFVCKGNCKPE